MISMNVLDVTDSPSLLSRWMKKCGAIVSCGNVSEPIELPPMEIGLGNWRLLEETGYPGMGGR
ncbi:MAG: hypothetical protein ACLS70_08495 [[Clostridium] symbiosum]